MNVEDLMKQSTIAAPCHVDWQDMSGDEKVRFCSQCKLNVMNSAAMTDEDVLQLLLRAQQGEQVCMRIYRRADGTFLTENCPVGLRRLRDRARQVAAWVAGALSMLLSGAVSAAPQSSPVPKDQTKPTWHSTIKGDQGTAQTTTPQAGAAATPRSVADSYPEMGEITVMPGVQQIQAQGALLAQLKKKEPGSIQVADALVGLAMLQARLNNHKDAVALQLEALKIYDTKQSFQQAGCCCSDASSLYTVLHDVQNALVYKQKAAGYQARIKKP